MCPRLAVPSLVALLVLAAGATACRTDASGDPSGEPAEDAGTDGAAEDGAGGAPETFTFGPEQEDPDEVRPPSDPVELDLAVDELSDLVPARDACAVLTGAEVGAILGAEVATLPDDGVCAYTVDGEAIALFEVRSPAAAAGRFEELADGGPARAPTQAVADVGDAALLSEAPEERVIVIDADAGYELGSSTGTLGWTTDQLTELARAIATA